MQVSDADETARVRRILDRQAPRYDRSMSRSERLLFPGAQEVSPETQRLVDDEVRRIVLESQEQVHALLRENRGRLDALAQALLEHETLDEDDAYAAAGVTRPRATPAGELTAAARSTT